MTGVALALGLRALDCAIEGATIADARVELLGWHLSRQIGGPVTWACVLWGTR